MNQQRQDAFIGRVLARSLAEIHRQSLAPQQESLGINPHPCLQVLELGLRELEKDAGLPTRFIHGEHSDRKTGVVGTSDVARVGGLCFGQLALPVKSGEGTFCKKNNKVYKRKRGKEYCYTN